MLRKIEPKCLAAVLVATLAAGCTGGLGCRSQVVLTGRLELPAGVRTVRVEIQNGSLKVEAGTEPAVVYEGGLRRAADTPELLGEIERIPARFTAAPDPAHPDTLVVATPALSVPEQLPRAILGFDVTIRVPPQVGVSVRVSGSGHLVADDRAAPLELVTNRGDLRVMRCTGATRLRTGQGMTIVYDHRGDLDVEVMTGDMQVFVREPGKRLCLVTRMGNIQCLVPPETGFRLDARAQTGKVANGFGIPIERSGYSGAMVGDRGDGRTSIVLRTETGLLSLGHKTFD